ncbi:hypothetical protein JG688_00000707 [Phytophthora aleatoria]|uniref:Telomeric repeat-binding factor 2-interacting protein 1 n=1 Tax=Phytophthora aleatoria TaxID=2496075 RepID=A0A8J5J4T6_9STRA|nr:hypothetical protein JG688_00000707 [Phytophthora aleatoria]
MAPSENALLFDGLKFFLTRTLSRDDAAELQRLIEQHGGVVSSSSAGATELVDYDKMDSWRPEWVSKDFIKDSVASGKLHNPAKYSGVVFSSRSAELHLKGRVQYSVEDDARLLHFAKLRGWQSMKSMPASAWKLAENDHVTNHTWQSMHEHFKKQLQSKTPKEQRAILARASEIIRTRLQRQEDQEEREQAAGTCSGSSIYTSYELATASPKGRKGTTETGDADMARTFLKGASPLGMWSPEDDLLLVNLVVEENIDRSAVDAAVARGDFASMQVPRDTNAILDRVQFLR